MAENGEGALTFFWENVIPHCKIKIQYSETPLERTEKGNTILKASHILRVITEGINRSSSIAAALGLSNSTTHRLLKILQKAEFVIQDPITMTYSIGPFVNSLAENYSRRHSDLIFCALSEMEKLRRVTGETIVLAVRTGIRRIYLEELPSFHLLKYAAGKGYAPPIYAGATGKVLLAQMPTAELLKLIDAIRLKKIGPNTITKRGALLEELNRVRQEGYAVSFSELVEGAASVAVPIRNYLQPAAICVLGPESRIRNRVDEILKHLRLCASAIERALQKTRAG